MLNQNKHVFQSATERTHLRVISKKYSAIFFADPSSQFTEQHFKIKVSKQTTKQKVNTNMARFGVALALLLTPPSVQSFHNFQPQSLSHIREKLVSRQATDKVQRGVSASSSGSAEFVSNIDTLNEALNTVTNAARDSIAEAVSDEPDSDEAEIALKQRMVGERVQTYSVTLPLASKKGKSEVLSIGLTLSQIRRGRVIDSNALNLDTLQFDENDGSKESDGVEKMDEATLLRRVDGEFQGLVVSSVVEGSSAWVAGVRAGDLLRTTSATVGSNLWPKSTLEGVRSAILSRKATSGSIQVEFQRLGEIVDNHFELTLSRPIGLELAGKNVNIFFSPALLAQPRGNSHTLIYYPNDQKRRTDT